MACILGYGMTVRVLQPASGIMDAPRPSSIVIVPSPDKFDPRFVPSPPRQRSDVSVKLLEQCIWLQLLGELYEAVVIVQPACTLWTGLYAN